MIPESEPADGQEDTHDEKQGFERNNLLRIGRIDRAIDARDGLATALTGRELAFQLRLTLSVLGAGKIKSDQAARTEQIDPEPNRVRQ